MHETDSKPVRDFHVETIASDDGNLFSLVVHKNLSETDDWLLQVSVDAEWETDNINRIRLGLDNNIRARIDEYGALVIESDGEPGARLFSLFGQMITEAIDNQLNIRETLE